MYSEVAWVLISSGTQVELQITVEPDYLPDYILSVSYDYDYIYGRVFFAKILKRLCPIDFC